MKRQAITLVDVIAAAVIVVVTVWLLAPAAVGVTNQDSASKQQAESIICTSNMRQLALGVIMYVQDYDEKYPAGANWHASGSGWAQQILPYVKSEQLYKCPSDPNKLDVSSYGYNSNLVRYTSNPPSPPDGVSVASLGSPDKTVALFETVNNAGIKPNGYTLSSEQFSQSNDIHPAHRIREPIDGWSPAGRGTGAVSGMKRDLAGMGAGASGRAPLQYATGLMRGSRAENGEFAPLGGRHFGMSNFAFGDGHVKRARSGSISAGYDNDAVGSCGTATRAANTGCADDTLTGTFSIQ